MNGSAKVLITGIGCVGKSTLRRRVAEALGRKVVCIDRDDADSEPELAPGQVLVVESVHGLEEPPERWGLVVYLLPPRGHTLRWIRRGLVWFRTGQVDRPPRVERRPWALQSIPLIVRLVGRNVWNASRWVKEDRKRIENNFSDHATVTDDPDLAFREIEQFISRVYEKREGMADGNKKIPVTPAGWIKESIKLDLIYDEEQKLPPEPEEIKPYCDLGDDFQGWYTYFHTLKENRIYSDLRFDNEKNQFSNSDSNFGYPELKKVAESRKINLDNIMWNCAAAISTLRAMEIDEEKNNNRRNTLIALFHSELCASATPDIFLGHASAFNSIFIRNDKKGEEKGRKFEYKLFDLIATHNIARGLNHQRLPIEAVTKIDRFVDEFLNVQDWEEIKNRIKDKIYKDPTDFIRVLIFPMILTLSQSLNDLRRYTEERYYLTRAYNFAKDQKNHIGFEYWQKLFKLNLAINNKDRGYSENKSELDCLLTKPRAENTRKSAKTSFVDNYSDVGDIECWKKEFLADVKAWKKNEISVLKWHSAEERPFSRHLETMSESILQILKCYKNIYVNGNNITNDIKDEIKGYVEKVLDTAQFGINKISHLSFLRKDFKDDDLPKQIKNRDFSSQWKQGKGLLKVLKEFKSQFKDTPFTYWQSNLENILKSDHLRPFHLEANEMETVPENSKPQNDSGWCLHCGSIKCGNSCSVNKLLMNPPNDKSKTSGTDSETDPVLASREYYYNVMSGQQKRFLSYLQKRTGRDRIYEQGEIGRPSPCFEIICLRRWNSFSPNLGSRAAATIGGGYFVRAWASVKENGRYIGIVIDPGYNFLENFFNEGFTIADIDLVVITHAHPDHIENFTNLLTLVREREKRLKKEKAFKRLISPKEHSILLAMTEGVFERIRLNLSAEEEFIRDVVVLSAQEFPFRGNNAGKSSLNLYLDEKYVCHMSLSEAELVDKKIVSLDAVRAWHDDYTGYDAIGLRVKHHNCKTGCNDIKCENYKKDIADRKILGIIGDSKYKRKLHKDYKECNVLVTHLGSLVDDDMYEDFHKTPYDNKFFENTKLIKNLKSMLAEKNHLYLPGIAVLICDLIKSIGPESYETQKTSQNGFPLMILSEFGEELRGGLRKDIAKRLSLFEKNGCKKTLPIIPGDVGLRVDIGRKKVFCCICHRYVEPIEIIPEAVLPDEESMTYVCVDCKGLRGGELNTLLEEWCRTARPVVPLSKEPKRSNGPNKDQD